jgi:hypothetical protein
VRARLEPHLERRDLDLKAAVSYRELDNAARLDTQLVTRAAWE